MRWLISILALVGSFILLTLIFDPSWGSFEVFPIILLAACFGFGVLFVLTWIEELVD